MPFSGEFINSYILQEIEIAQYRHKIVVEIGKKNANYSKRLMKFSDIRHSDNLVGCSFRNEHSYCFCHFSENGLSDLEQEIEPLEKLTQFFYVDNRNFVKQQDSLFKHLWA